MILTIEPLSGVTIKKVLGSKPPKQSGGGGGGTPLKVDTPHPGKKTQAQGSSSNEDENDNDDDQILQKEKKDQKLRETEEQKLREIEEQKLRDIEEAQPGKETPEYLQLGDFYSEETRDIVFYLQLPSHPEPTPEFKIANITMNYYNVITEKYDKVSAQCVVKRSPEIPVSQTRDFSLDLQINRLTAAAAMEEAQTHNHDMAKARQIISTAIARLKASISVQDPFTESLIADLNEILGDMKDKATFERVAVAKMAWKGDAHKKQRAIGSAGTGYQTSAKSKMQAKAKEYSKEKKNLIVNLKRKNNK